jgi:PAS domain S-box-containing protein
MAGLAGLVDALTVALMVEGDEGGIRLANPALVAMFGLAVVPDDLVGSRLSDPPPPGVPEPAWTALRKISRQPGEGSLEVTLDDGRVLECACTPISEAGGHPGRVWVLRDITASVEARRALQEHNERLAALSALKSEFIAIVSHELRTPLTSISAFTEMLGGPGELTSSDAPAAVAAIARNTDRMLVLVQDLILLSQLETGDQSVATGAVDVADLAREVGDAIDAGGHVITVQPKIANGPLVEGDERLLRQLIHTIVGTVAACAAGKTLTLRAEPDDAGWTVEATAPTDEFITGEQLLALPLAVLDDASRQRSAALSVLLARAVAHSHGGALLVDVKPDATATITVRLPLHGPHRLP